MTGVIYELIDPRDGSCRYVGKTFDPGHRKASHLAKKPVWQHNAPLHRWKHELSDSGLQPIFSIIEAGVEPAYINNREREWCAKRSSDGCRLLNARVGSIRGIDLVHGGVLAEAAESAIEIRDILFSIHESVGLPSSHKAMKELRKCCESLLAFKNLIT